MKLEPMRGSATFLFVTMVLPVLFVASVLGLELAGYYAATNRMQQVADEAARLALRFTGDNVVADRAVESFVANSVSPAPATAIERSTGSVSVTLVGGFDSTFLSLLARFAGREGQSIAIGAKATAKEVSAISTLVINVPGDLPDACASRRTQFVIDVGDSIAAHLYRVRPENLRLAISPGRSAPLDPVDGYLCDGALDTGCGTSVFISPQVVCSADFLTQRPAVEDSFSRLLGHLLEREQQASESGGWPHFVTLVAPDDMPQSLDSYLFSLGQLSALLEENGARLSLAAVFVDDSAGEAAPLRYTYGPLSLVVLPVSPDAVPEEAGAMIAALQRSEVVAQ